MARGLLRVYLGAAPGVGKTFSMLEDGLRLREQGDDVVIGLVEAHGRNAIVDLSEGFERMPRAVLSTDPNGLGEVDVPAILTRAPGWVLIDELAHSNAPGSPREKRWQDVEELLAAGINVISTVNIQHVESLGDAVESITGLPQRESVPDAVLRAADQVELVDLSPEALRERLARGLVVSGQTIDAALSHFFRTGNLTALRELALLWVADDVDAALQAYRSRHSIRGRWDARERVVVAIPGGPADERLIRRGARIAARSTGAQLLAVHVAGPHRLSEADPGALESLRALVESLGGTYHQLVSDDTVTALLEFAEGVGATQLVIGSGRRTRFAALTSGRGIGAAIIEGAGEIDVHVMGRPDERSSRVRPRGSALSLRRRVWGSALGAFGIPLLTAALAGLRGPDSLVGDVLAFQLLVVLVALVGGIWPAVASAVVGALCLDFFFVEPLYTIRIATPAHAVTLVIFVVVAALVSVVVDLAARRSLAASRAGTEAETMAAAAGSVIRGENAVEALANRLRESFGLAAVTVVSADTPVYQAGAPLQGDTTTRVDFDGGHLLLSGSEPGALGGRVLGAYTAQIATALEQERLRAVASGMRPLEEADRLRTALLAAVGHDLRTPLAAATAAVSSLRSTDVHWSDGDRAELLETADASLRRLARLVADLLDASRLQAGVLPISLSTVGLEEVVPLALDELGSSSDSVLVQLPDALPPVIADPVLVQRVLVNLLSNAARFSPPGRPPTVSGSAFAGRVELRVIDHGPGIPVSRIAEAFQPFQRLGDSDASTGVGLGLALANGFMTAMGGSLEAEQTPGGGLTTVMSFAATHPTPEAHR